MSNILNRTSVGIATLFAAVGLSSTAQANSITLSINGGDASGSLNTVSGISNTFTVTVFADLSGIGGGLDLVVVDLGYDSSMLTATGCREDNQSGTYPLGTSPSPHFGQVVEAGVYQPFLVASIPNCGPGSPGNGGLVTPGNVPIIAQEFEGSGTRASSGTLILGTVTFHLASFGTNSVIEAAYRGTGGFVGGDFISRTTGALGSVSVTNSVIPEPATISLIGLGILGLALAGRGHSRRG